MPWRAPGYRWQSTASGNPAWIKGREFESKVWYPLANDGLFLEMGATLVQQILIRVRSEVPLTAGNQAISRLD
jgi:hypothetical protein